MSAFRSSSVKRSSLSDAPIIKKVVTFFVDDVL
jgi:hypothetical protein